MWSNLTAIWVNLNLARKAMCDVVIMRKNVQCRLRCKRSFPNLIHFSGCSVICRLMCVMHVLYALVASPTPLARRSLAFLFLAHYVCFFLSVGRFLFIYTNPLSNFVCAQFERTIIRCALSMDDEKAFWTFYFRFVYLALQKTIYGGTHEIVIIKAWASLFDNIKWVPSQMTAAVARLQPYDGISGRFRADCMVLCE